MPSSASCRDAHAVMPRPRGIQDRTASDAVVLVKLRILTGSRRFGWMPQRQVVGLAPGTGTANTQWGAVKFSDSCPEPPDQGATLRYRVRPPGLIKNPAILPLRGVAGCASGLICRAPRCPRRGGVPRTVARPLKRPGPIQKSDAEAK